jgi:diaminopimelate decarboxylase
VVPVLLRITPGVKAETHEYVATGQDDSKFGFTVSTGLARRAVEAAQASPAVDLRGIHAHIGSQVFRVDSFAAAVGVLGEFFNPLGLEELVVGGGLGVPYVEGEESASLSQWGKVLRSAAAEAGIVAPLGVEPGRSIVAAAAVTLYTVGTVKELPGVRTYVSVDGGMSDNPRPVLYGSGYEAFLAGSAGAERPKEVRVVGKHCESGDLLVRQARVPESLAVGDVLATPVTGAYGHSMGSNYNKILRPPVVFCRDGDARLVVRRENLDDLLATDVG